MPGTPIDRPDLRASGCGEETSSSETWVRYVPVAAIGAVSRPSILVSSPVSASW